MWTIKFVAFIATVNYLVNIKETKFREIRRKKEEADGTGVLHDFSQTFDTITRTHSTSMQSSIFYLVR